MKALISCLVKADNYDKPNSSYKIQFFCGTETIRESIHWNSAAPSIMWKKANKAMNWQLQGTTQTKPAVFPTVVSPYLWEVSLQDWCTYQDLSDN